LSNKYEILCKFIYPQAEHTELNITVYNTYVFLCYMQGDQKVSVHLIITIQKVTSNVQSFLRQFPDIY